MLKVYILDLCPYCDGQAYLPAGEATNWKGETFIRDRDDRAIYLSVGVRGLYVRRSEKHVVM